MANKKLFASRPNRTPVAGTRNEAGGRAYDMPAEHSLAQLALTGCFRGTYYTDAHTQLDTISDLSMKVAPLFLAQTAVYAHQKGCMKDMPAFLLAVLSKRDAGLFRRVFDRIIDRPRMLRTFVQIMRSGAAGRTSLGTAPRAMIRQWLEGRDGARLLSASIGNDPSLKDIIRMVHPRPVDAARAALYRYFIDREVDHDLLPPIIQDWERFKREGGEPPDVPFQLLTAKPLNSEQWSIIARRASWHTLRMNLMTFLRHKVYQQEELVESIAARLCDEEEIARAVVFPFQTFVAWKQTQGRVPTIISDALVAALEVSVANCPHVSGRICVCPDLSGSMGSPVTGSAEEVHSSVTCSDVAALISVAFLRRNPGALLVPFDEVVLPVKGFDPEGGFMRNTKALSRSGGGTACSAPVEYLRRQKEPCDLVIIVSDNQSWVDTAHGTGTALLEAWMGYKKISPGARLACLNLQPYTTAQAPERDDIINIGGFSDNVFGLLADFAEGHHHPDYWVDQIGIMEV